ncbi:serpin family protein [uncultured Succiniclasticum sp.]|uniref:serpin family protein n=1 Tax=uncultured Succiniclasticum sp. TaxID=1500547 RepID=UPI00344D96F4
MKVNREGTEAAAVTYMPGITTTGVRLDPEPKEIKLDRPFVYAIMHNETSIPVFIGILNSMK